jgi:hypothetical protein
MTAAAKSGTVTDTRANGAPAIGYLIDNRDSSSRGGRELLQHSAITPWLTYGDVIGVSRRLAEYKRYGLQRHGCTRTAETHMATAAHRGPGAGGGQPASPSPTTHSPASSSVMSRQPLVPNAARRSRASESRGFSTLVPSGPYCVTTCSTSR